MMTRILLAAYCVATVVGPAVAIDVPIDRFEAATNTVQTSAFFGFPPNPANVADTGVPGVIGGSRALTVFSADFFVRAGVIPADGVMDYMSIGLGFATTTYDGGGGPLLTRAISCSEALEIDYDFADAPAISGVTIGIVLVDGASAVSAPIALPLTGSAGTLSFPLSDFVGVDLDNIAELSVTINGDDDGDMANESPDLALREIRAVNCDFSETPAPTMGAVALAMATVMLMALGYLGFRRRFS